MVKIFRKVAARIFQEIEIIGGGANCFWRGLNILGSKGK